MTLTKVLAQIEADFASHLEDARDWIRQPSISATGEGMADTVAKVAAELTGLGVEAQIVDTPGYPAVVGALDAGAPVTVLLYGMYDVQPVAGEAWSSPPFAAAIRDLEGIGPSIVGRGARNQKGPLAAMFSVIRAFRASGTTLPVNLRFLIEGEEELGSRHLPLVLREYRDYLQADVAFFPVFSQEASGKPFIHLGVKGLIYFELAARGGAWGGPRHHMIHSRNAVWVSNPAWRLVHALASLQSPEGDVLVPGFYDDAVGPTAAEEALLARLARTFDRPAMLRELDAERFSIGDDGDELVRRYCFRPTLNVDGLAAGFTGEGTKTVIPHEARAKLDFRLVTGMSPDKVLKQLRTHLDQQGFHDIDITIHSSYPAARIAVTDPAAQALIQACTLTDQSPEVWPTLAGSAPFYLFEQELGIPFVMGGLGHAARSHSPDEYCTVDGLRQLERSIARFFYHLREEVRAS